MAQVPNLWRGIDRSLKAIAMVAGGVALAAMTGLSVFNVLIMRKAMNSPIQGAEDILILMLVFIVAVSIPFGARNGAHIEIEILESYMSPLVSKVSLILVKVFGVAILALMSWRLWISDTAASRFGETTQQLLISYEPFYYVLSVAIGIYAAILVVEIGLLVGGHDLEHSDTDGDLSC